MMLFPNQLDSCSFAIASSGPRIPTAYSPKAMCVWNGPDNNTDCSVEFYSPDVDKWHYARIVTANITNIYNITLKITTESKFSLPPPYDDPPNLNLDVSFNSLCNISREAENFSFL